MEIRFGLEDINEAAASFLEAIGDRKVVAFKGEMGAGKTSFITALCRSLQVSGTVSSPTFSIINEYIFPSGTVYHLDLYRLKGEAEALQAGVEDAIHSGEYCFVEWPERAAGLFPPETLWVELLPADANSRILRQSDSLTPGHG